MIEKINRRYFVVPVEPDKYAVRYEEWMMQDDWFGKKKIVHWGGRYVQETPFGGKTYFKTAQAAEKWIEKNIIDRENYYQKTLDNEIWLKNNPKYQYPKD